MEQQLALNFAHIAYDELAELARKLGITQEAVVLRGLDLVKDVIEAADNNQKVIVETESGEAVKEIVLPET